MFGIRGFAFGFGVVVCGGGLGFAFAVWLGIWVACLALAGCCLLVCRGWCVDAGFGCGLACDCFKLCLTICCLRWLIGSSCFVSAASCLGVGCGLI